MKDNALFRQHRSLCGQSILSAVTLVIAILLVAPFAGAQSTGGRIRGTVTDPSGGAVAGATVTLINEATGSTRQVQTSGTGDYTFIEVPVGTYEIDVNQQGFKKHVRKDVAVNLNEVVTVDLALRVGGTTEVVEVSGAALVVDTTSTQLGAVMNSVAVSELPLNLRNTYALLQLQPGVSSQFGSSDTVFFGADNPGVVSVNGGRGRANNYMVNGGDGNDLFVNLPQIQPSPDAIEEFRVLTNTFDAEYGRNSGSVVNVVTKSGTNQLHGDFYEYFRNTILDANTFFNNASSRPVPDFKQNQFGGTLGGPIRKDHTFFFGSYEGRRIRQGISSGNVFLPTAGEISGDFSAGGTASPFSGTLASTLVADILNNRPGCAAAVAAQGGMSIASGNPYGGTYDPKTGAFISPGIFTQTTATGALVKDNQIPTQCFDPVAVNLFQQFVQPVDPSGTGLAVTSPDKKVRGDQATAHLDHKISASQQFSAYYYFDDESRLEPFAFFQAAGANVPGFGSLYAQRVQQWNLSHTWTINPTSVNEFRFNYFREAQQTENHPVNIHPVISSCTGAAANFCFNGTPDTPTAYMNAGITPSPSLGITPNLPGREGVPFISVSGGFIIGNNSEGELPQTGNTFQWTDNFTKVLGNHTVKFGGDARVQHFYQFLYFDVNGSFGFSPGGTNDVGLTTSSGRQDLYPNYFLGLPTSFGQGSAQLENVRSSALYLFAQDSWKLKPNLTLNYGLRWELDTPQYDTGNRLQTFRPGQADTLYPCVIGQNGSALTRFTVGTDCSPTGPGAAVFPLGEVIPGDKGVQRGMTSTYYKAFAPRIGLAWSPGATSGWLSKLTGGPGKFSVRAGYGIFYNPIEQLVLEQFSAEPPFGGSTFVSNPLLQTPYVLQGGSTIPNPFNGVLSPKPNTPCFFSGGPNGCVDWSVFRPILLFGEFQPHLRTQYSDQYNLTLQRQLTKSMILQVGYVGTQAHRLLASHDINFGNAQTCFDLNDILGARTCGPFGEDVPYFIPANTVISTTSKNPACPGGLLLPYNAGSGGNCVASGTTVGPNGITLVGIRPFSSPLCQPLTGTNCPPDGTPVFSNIFAEDTISNSSYHALQVSLEQSSSHGLQFKAAYTFSKSLDNASSFEELLNPVNPRLSRSLSLFNATHRFVFSPYWTLPIPKYDGFKGKLLDGWGTSAIITYQTGFPIRILDGDDTELMGSFFFLPVGEPFIHGPFRTMNPRSNPSHSFFDTSIFSDPFTSNTTPTSPCSPGGNLAPADPCGVIGNASRTICCGPSISNTDISILKRTRINERWDTEFRAEFFNVWNHTQFLNPDGNFSDSTFGVVTNTRDPRVIQFALKFLF